MKRTIYFVLVTLCLFPPAVQGGDGAIYLNAFGETATAYLSDAFLLLGTTADGFVADIIPAKTALEIGKNVQKRVRVIRAKLQIVSAGKLTEADRQLINLLDQAFACMDHQSWALVQYIEEKSPDTAKRFEEKRIECLERIKNVAEFYSTLPPSAELPEPLSTR